jgi:plastocyanin
MRRTMIATAAVLVAAALGGQAIAGGSESAKRAKKVTVDNFDFKPAKVKISPGTKVTWTATQGSHTVTFKDGYDEVITENGTTSTSRKFKNSGTYKYVCRFHKDKGQKGKVVVG